MKLIRNKSELLVGALLLTPLAAGMQNVLAEPLPGGTLDPLTIPKYVTPLVIPPVMKNTGTANDYDIAVRQFQQQILPGGIWATLPGCTGANCTFPPTTVWSYGPAADTPPAVAPHPTSQFNYPAYTIEATNGNGDMSGTTITVDWINGLVDANGNYLPHLLPVDRSLHWANPEKRECAENLHSQDCQPKRTDEDLDGNGVADLLEPYTGPVPIVTHVHGAHVGPESDGYPEAWWLPAANNIPEGYATQGTLVNKYGIETNDSDRPGVGTFTYQNDQPSTTLWYHDHTLGMTRNNVYAGPAGFWLVRQNDGGEDGVAAASVLPGPAPVAGQEVLELNVPGSAVRNSIREIPVVIQGRSFNTDGSLFYPANRAFFEGLGDGQTRDNNGAGLSIPFANADSDIAPIWNPEAFFNVMVVNGVSWPEMEVAPAKYRLRLLNGTNSRFLNLHMALFDVDDKKEIRELPFYQIGAEQSVLPHVVRIEKGYATPLPGDGSDVNMRRPSCTKKNGKTVQNCVVPKPAPFAEQAMLIGPAERADVIVDFSSFEDGDIVRMFNTAPDAPFGGFPDEPADPSTTGQVMQFRVNSALLGASPTDPGGATPATDPWNLVLSLPDADDPANGGVKDNPRDLALLEEESLKVCVNVAPDGTITWDSESEPDHAEPETCVDREDGEEADSVPFAPKAAVLGTNGSSGGTVQLWSDTIAQNPDLGATETWELWNHSADAHPIHLHLVKFKVVNRQAIDPVTGQPAGEAVPASAHEAGWKDTVIAYPGEVTRLNATFDKAGLYVWHCHIVEHEDNKMMVPFCVGEQSTSPGCNVVP